MHRDTQVDVPFPLQAVAPVYRYAVNQGVQTAAKYAVKKSS